jgi:hypothetical protein
VFDDEGIDNNQTADGLTAFVAVEASVIDRNNPVSGNRKGKSDSAITFSNTDWISVMDQFHWPKQLSHRHYTEKYLV